MFLSFITDLWEPFFQYVSLLCLRNRASDGQTDRETDRDTHAHTKYSNPRCACTPRVNYRFDQKASSFGIRDSKAANGETIKSVEDARYAGDLNFSAPRKHIPLACNVVKVACENSLYCYLLYSAWANIKGAISVIQHGLRRGARNTARHVITAILLAFLTGTGKTRNEEK